MTDTLDDLILDLLEWLGPGSRPYPEVLDAWHTSCPRFPVWEGANERGLVERRHVPGHGQFVSVSVAGAELLKAGRGERAHDVALPRS
jgi:D-3-phosphoglycerate dehydrogenase